MILQDIHDALARAVGPRVYYGAPTNHPDGEPWDYVVFSRDRFSRNSGRTGYTDVINVAIAREGFVPNDAIDAAISTLESIPGVRLADGSCEFDYAISTATGDVVELVRLQFTRSRKAKR